MKETDNKADSRMDNSKTGKTGKTGSREAGERSGAGKAA